jgi:hypothetical protein
MSETPSSPALPGPLAKLSGSTLLWIQAIAAAVAVISVFLPWATAEAFGISESGNGFDEEWNWVGILVLLLGIAVAALSFTKARGVQVQGLSNLPPILNIVLPAALFLFSLIGLITVYSKIGDIEDDIGDLGAIGDFGFDVSVSFGIWLVFLASLVAFLAALLPWLQSRKSA